MLLLRLLLLHRQYLLLPRHLKKVVRARERHIVLLVVNPFLLVDRSGGLILVMILGESASICASELLMVLKVLFLLLEN